MERRLTQRGRERRATLMRSAAQRFAEQGYHQTSVAEIVDCIDRTVQATGSAPVRPIHKPGRGFDVPRVVLDISRARADLGWSPRTGLNAGIAETWDWVRGRV